MKSSQSANSLRFATFLLVLGGLAAGVCSDDASLARELTYASWRSYKPAMEGAQVTYRESKVSRSGRTSAQITVPPGSAVTFYHYYRDLPSPQRGDLYEFSGWIKTEHVAGGAGAFLAIGAVDAAGRRFVAADSERLTGTQEWVQAKCALFIPEGAHALRLLLLLHGTGQAYFDHVELQRLKSFRRVDTGRVQISVADQVITDQFMGFGVEDDAYFFTDENFRHGISDDDLALRARRIAQLNPAVVATLFWWDAINPAHDLKTITYDTELMRALYRVLAPHQAAHRTVLLSDAHWGWSKDQFAYSEQNVERGVSIYVGLLKHLIQDQGFTCLRYVSITGEVDLRFESTGGSFESYISANRLLRKGLDEAGLSNVRIIGDKSGGLIWFRRAIQRADPYFGLFAVHEYPDVTQYPVINYRLSQALKVVKQYSAPLTMSTAGPVYKPAFVWEIGYRDQGAGDTDRKASAMHKYSYGLLCARTCIAALNEGFTGGSVWCLHSMYYPGQNRMDFGFWEFKDKGWAIRPSYYAYALFTRFARPRMKPLRVNTRPQFSDFAAAALADPSGRRVLFALNLSEKEVTAQLRGLPQRPYDLYEYAEDRLPTPGDWNYEQVEVLQTGHRWSPANGGLRIRPRTLIMLR